MEVGRGRRRPFHPRPESAVAASARFRIIMLARIPLPTSEGTLTELTARLRRDTGVGEGAFRTLLPRGEGLLREVGHELLTECAQRVQSAAESFSPRDHPNEDFAVPALNCASSRRARSIGVPSPRFRQRQPAASTASAAMT